MRRGKNAELILKDTLTLYGEVLALGRDWVELECQMGRVRVKAPPERLEELAEGQVVGLRVLAQVARGFIWGRGPKEEGEVGGLVIQPPKLRHFYPASRVMSCMLCPSASSITSFGVR
jgi:hypothetical protein